MSRAKRRYYKQAAETEKVRREAAIDESRADLPWYMQRNMGVVLARWIRRVSLNPRP